MDIVSVTSAQAVQGLQLTDSNGKESVEGGFLGLFSSLQTVTPEVENLVDETVIDTEIGKPLPEDGESLPDFIQFNVLEAAESKAIIITDEPFLAVGELPAMNADKPDVVTPVLVGNTTDEQMVAAARTSVLPVFSSPVPLEKPVDEPVVATATKSTTLAGNHLPEITTAYLKEGQALAAKKELPVVKHLSQPGHSNTAIQITEADLDPRVLEAIDRQPLKPEMDAALAEEPVVTDKRVEPYQALRMANVKVAVEPGISSESLAANTVNMETRTSSGTGSVLRSESATFSPEPQAPLTLSLRQANWDKSLSNNVQWMVKEDIQAATIRVRPAELGPLNIQISVQQDQLNINISANQAVTREALEAALPRLREQFASQGYSQINVDISDQGQPQSGQEGLAEQSNEEAPVFSSIAEGNQDQEENLSRLSQSIHNSLLDTFA